MPHIIVMHSMELDVDKLCRLLHDALSIHESVQKIQTKTFSTPIHNVIVADGSKSEDMLHILLRMKASRDAQTKNKIAQSIHDAVRKFVDKQNIKACISVDIQDIDPATYVSSYA
jgi:5-carboxymethyl-2-hydroxymuconate isomerase